MLTPVHQLTDILTVCHGGIGHIHAAAIGVGGQPEGLNHTVLLGIGGNKSRIRKRRASASSSSATAGASSRCSSYWWGSRQMTAGKPAGKVANQLSSPCQPLSADTA